MPVRMGVIQPAVRPEDATRMAELNQALRRPTPQRRRSWKIEIRGTVEPQVTLAGMSRVGLQENVFRTRTNARIARAALKRNAELETEAAWAHARERGCSLAEGEYEALLVRQAEAHAAAKPRKETMPWIRR